MHSYSRLELPILSDEVDEKDEAPWKRYPRSRLLAWRAKKRDAAQDAALGYEVPPHDSWAECDEISVDDASDNNIAADTDPGVKTDPYVADPYDVDALLDKLPEFDFGVDEDYSGVDDDIDISDDQIKFYLDKLSPAMLENLADPAMHVKVQEAIRERPLKRGERRFFCEFVGPKGRCKNPKAMRCSENCCGDHCTQKGLKDGTCPRHSSAFAEFLAVLPRLIRTKSRRRGGANRSKSIK